MTTVKEFKQWLDRFPDDAIVEIAKQESPHLYQSYGAVEFQDIKLDDSDFGDGWEFIDFTNNQFVKKEDSHYYEKAKRDNKSVLDSFKRYIEKKKYVKNGKISQKDIDTIMLKLSEKYL